MATSHAEHYVRALPLSELVADSTRVVHLDGQTVALFHHRGAVYAVDNRCPHMGFPLDRGSVCDGILTCHWHHARFDLAGGGTFDPWADDVRAYPVKVADGDVWVDVAPPADPPVDRFRKRLHDGLRQNLRLVIAKAVIGLHASGAPDRVALEAGADLGTRFAANGWGPGLTIMTAMANILPSLRHDDRPRALYHGLSHVAREVAGQTPAVRQESLPGRDREADELRRWFRQLVEMRNADGAERALRTAIDAGLPMPVVADMLFAAATDHLYLSIGHPMDFANKAFELLDLIGWEHAQAVLPSLVPSLARGQRSEELMSWRHPVDLAQMLRVAFEGLPGLAEDGRRKEGLWDGRAQLVEVLLGDDPGASVAALQQALVAGATGEQLAGAVALAAARRVAQFHTSNEFGDWDTVLHTFTYAHAVHQAMRRAPSVELLRGVFDGAMSVYLDRFLNTPAAPLPRAGGPPPSLPADLLELLDRQQQVNSAGQMAVAHLRGGGSDSELLASIGQALLREDADFHTFQVVEAAFGEYAGLAGTEDGEVMLVAAARYLAAHCPTSRAAGQTYQTALRLHRGERLWDG